MSDSANPIVLGQGLAANVLPGQLELLQAFLPVDRWLVARRGPEGMETFFLAGERALGLARYVARLTDLSWEAHTQVDRLSWCRLVSAEPDATGAKTTAGGPVLATLFKFVWPEQEGEQDEFIILGASPDTNPFAALEAGGRHINLCLNSIANTLSLVSRLENAKKALADARHDARIDPLTKVLNRAGWNDYLRASNDDPDMAIAFVDVDFLKYVNDTQGHLAGDKLLKQTAQVLKAMLRPGDCVARLGGDEFAVALRNFKEDDVGTFRQGLNTLLDEQGIHVSFGIAFRAETESISRTMRLADMRMYEEKRLKKQTPP